MKTAYQANWLGWLGLLLAAMLTGTASAKDVRFDVLHFRTGVLTNATVFTVSQTDICVSHSKGLINIKLVDLDAETLRALGLAPGPETTDSFNIMAAAKSIPDASGSYMTAAMAANPKLEDSLSSFQGKLKSLPQQFLLVVLGVFVAFYIFNSYCLKLIVEKAGAEPGFLIWVPVLQFLPMLWAARMSGWWIIPVANVIGMIMWTFKIVEVRGKSGWVTLFLLLPFTSFLAFLYLAFSSGVDKDDQKAPTKLSVEPPPLSEAA